MIINKKIFFFLIVITFLSCDKPDNFDNIAFDYQYKGSFSFVIGNSNLNLKNNGKNLPTDWINYPEKLAITDSIKLSTYFYLNINDISIDKSDTIINFIEFKIRGNNEFPVSASVTCYLADSLKNIINNEEIFNINIDPATVNDSTIVSTTTFYVIKSFSLKEIKKWQKVRYFFISVVLNNQNKNNDGFKYYENLNIQVGLGIRVDFNFNLKDV